MWLRNIAKKRNGQTYVNNLIAARLIPDAPMTPFNTHL